MNPFEMVVIIVAIVTLGRILSIKYAERHGRHRGGGETSESERMRAEIAQLKDRIATLERLAVDRRQRLADEIDSLGRK